MVVASSVDSAGVLQRQGFYNRPLGAPLQPGLECSSRVAVFGTGAAGCVVGGYACTLLSGSGYTEKVNVPVGQPLPVPTGVDLTEAPVLPEVTSTVRSIAVQTFPLRPGARAATQHAAPPRTWAALGSDAATKNRS